MSNAQRNEKCEHRVDTHLTGRLSDLRTLWERDRAGKEFDDDLGNLADYGLSFDYIEPQTYNDQPEGYFRYQLSWGGPSDEFRFFVNPDYSCHRVEYWFMDWFDGASRTIIGNDRDFLLRLWTYLSKGLER